MSTIKERYSPIVLAANGSATLTGSMVGGFLCITSGTITITGLTDAGASRTIVNALPVTAGVYYPIPFYIGEKGGTVTLAGGASGTLGV